ncbi:MAG TPA: CRISPR-associated endoribonuclease Cas6 [Candidatus Blautia faecipullorum]|nr:CRISPR-associated endoribonuclease Cas6 [Candidatus Blautia faecipullorum]
MQLLLYIKPEKPIVLPINYQHILQSILYRTLAYSSDLSDFIHDAGYAFGDRQYKMFQFSLLEGKYQVCQKKIRFEEYLILEIRSPENRVIQMLAQGFRERGIWFGDIHCGDVEVELRDYTIEAPELEIRMKTPITVYSTDRESGSTYFYAPDDELFYAKVCDNFFRKYYAYYGVPPASEIILQPICVTEKDKFVTRYKQSYITGWYGVYRLSGKRKYLDFLYQAGLGGKNSQGFGMFQLL